MLSRKELTLKFILWLKSNKGVILEEWLGHEWEPLSPKEIEKYLEEYLMEIE